MTNVDPLFPRGYTYWLEIENRSIPPYLLDIITQLDFDFFTFLCFSHCTSMPSNAESGTPNPSNMFKSSPHCKWLRSAFDLSKPIKKAAANDTLGSYLKIIKQCNKSFEQAIVTLTHHQHQIVVR